MRRGKHFLLGAERLERQIEATLRKVTLYKSLTERVTARLEKENVIQSRDVTSNESAILRLMEAEEQLKTLYAEYEESVSEILSVLASLSDPANEKLLVEVFLKHYTFEMIAKREHVSRACVYKRCERALDELEKLLCP